MIGVLLRYSDSHGNPMRGGRLHFVVVSDEGPPPPVDQMALRGRYPNQDCGVAAVTSCAEARHKSFPPSTVLESDEGNSGGGASIAGLANGFRACGLTPGIEHATPHAPRLWVMNVAGARELDPAHSGPDLAMAAEGFPDGWFVRVVDAAPAPVPPQSGGTPAPAGGHLVHVDEQQAEHIGRTNLYFENPAHSGHFVKFGTAPMASAAPLYQWVGNAPAPQHVHFVGVDGAEANRIHRPNLFYRDNNGHFLPFNANALPQGARTQLYKRVVT